jgi:hypothetical protein
MSPRSQRPFQYLRPRLRILISKVAYIGGARNRIRAKARGIARP